MLSSFVLSERFFLQLGIILLACRGMGWLARRLGQPSAVGEMVAGVLLGPSLFGFLWPQAQAWLFPRESMVILFAVSHVGLSLYMFLVGVDFRQEIIQRQARTAAAVSVVGILVPFALGAIIGVWLLPKPGFFGGNVHAIDAGMFLGAAMAITAFPMLARILEELGLSGTSLGTLALAAGAIDDAAAWCILAVVLAFLDHNLFIATKAIFGGVLYAVVMLKFVRPKLQPLGERVERTGKLTSTQLGWILVLLMLGSWFTDWLGIYEVFGAFILGVAMPRGLLAAQLKRLLHPITAVLLLPLFFTYSGLNTRLDMVAEGPLILIGLLLLGAASLGKGAACYAAARWQGENHRTALAIGTLMNARGLMELIILNIGLQRGIIQPNLFTLMVMMAIVTTLLAAPLCALFYGHPRPLATPEEIHSAVDYPKDRLKLG